MKLIRVIFLTGTRADYGKLKPLMNACERDVTIENYIYATGMHLLKECGYTINEIKADGYKNIYTPAKYKSNNKMELELADTIIDFSKFICEISPDLIIVHGDRVEPLAGAIVGVMNNIKVAHIEGGEVTGTADEFIRHAITKLSNLHFVANKEAKFRLLQLGELEENIYVIGSPDIDIMVSDCLPDIKEIKHEYKIDFAQYAVFIYHPVTTSTRLSYETEQVVRAVLESKYNYIVIMPNNDHGCDTVRLCLNELKGNKKFRMFASVPFEKFLVILKNSEFIIGNSSAGIREACVYGVPAIDIGTRQSGRYNMNVIRNIQHCKEDAGEILQCINNINDYRHTSQYFGDGHSAEKFISAIKGVNKVQFQKKFVETAETSNAIMNYINEVCF